MNLLHCNDKHVQFEYYFTKALAQKHKLRNYFGWSSERRKYNIESNKYEIFQFDLITRFKSWWKP